MPETIVCQLTVTLGSGPRWTSTRAIEVEATDVIRITVEAGAEDKEVEVQPGSEVRVLFISPDPPSEKLNYATESGATERHTLDEPHLLPGTGAVGLLGGNAPPTSLFFTNEGAVDASVTILVGRDATP
jgi:hypothetical protein